MYESQIRDINMSRYFFSEKSNHQSYPAMNHTSYDNHWPDRICPFAHSDMDVFGVTNYFLIVSNVCSMRLNPFPELLMAPRTCGLWS